MFPLARYEMNLDGSVKHFEQVLTDFLSKESFIVEHRDKEIDLSKAVRSANMSSGKLSLDLSVCSQKGANANPFLVLDKIFGYDKEKWGDFFIEKTAVMAETV